MTGARQVAGAILTQALDSIGSMTQSLDLCWKGSGVPAKEMAGRLILPPKFPNGVEYGHFVRMFREHDYRHFPPDLIEVLMRESKSLLPLEWLAWRMGYCLHEKSTTAILAAIRDAMTAVGQEPKFLITENGRIEPVREVWR